MLLARSIDKLMRWGATLKYNCAMLISLYIEWLIRAHTHPNNKSSYEYKLFIVHGNQTMATRNKDMTNLAETILKIKYDEQSKKIITQLIQRLLMVMNGKKKEPDKWIKWRRRKLKWVGMYTVWCQLRIIVIHIDIPHVSIVVIFPVSFSYPRVNLNSTWT